MARVDVVRLKREKERPVARVLAADLIAVVAVYAHPAVALPGVVEATVERAVYLAAARQARRLLRLPAADAVPLPLVRLHQVAVAGVMPPLLRLDTAAGVVVPRA